MTAGIDVPDERGRTGLDLVGLSLSGNPDVVVHKVEVLANDWYVLRATTFDRRTSEGTWRTERRETYDRGDGATILLYDLERNTVLLTRQFRFPAYVNGHPDGMLIETAAGLLDDDDPEAAIRREAVEETGVQVGSVQSVFELFMSPGSVTERLHFYAAPYTSSTQHGTRHGVVEEGEDIEVMELQFDDALSRIGADIVDAKTVLLLQWAALHGVFARRSTSNDGAST